MARIDNRKNDQIRDIKITRNYTKYAEGSVLIEMGSTKVICTASIEDKVPPFLRNTSLPSVIRAICKCGELGEPVCPVLPINSPLDIWYVVECKFEFVSSTFSARCW